MREQPEMIRLGAKKEPEKKEQKNYVKHHIEQPKLIAGLTIVDGKMCYDPFESDMKPVPKGFKKSKRCVEISPTEDLGELGQDYMWCNNVVYRVGDRVKLLKSFADKWIGIVMEITAFDNGVFCTKHPISGNMQWGIFMLSNNMVIEHTNEPLSDLSKLPS